MQSERHKETACFMQLRIFKVVMKAFHYFSMSYKSVLHLKLCFSHAKSEIQLKLLISWSISHSTQTPSMLDGLGDAKKSTCTVLKVTDCFLQHLQVVLCQINIFCHQLSQNATTNFVRFTKIVLKFQTQVLNW